MDWPLRFAVAGAGGMGSSHISALSHLPDYFEVVAICDANLDAAVAAKEKFQLHADVYDNIAAVLETPNLDGLVIALPHDQHAASTIQALEGGINVLCEKPGSLTQDEFDTVAAAVNQSQAIYAVAFNKRYYRIVEQAEALINFGEIGEILHVVVNDEWRHRGLHDLFEQSGAPNWRAQEKHMGRMGIGNDTTAHSLSLLTALTMHQPNEVFMVDSRGNQPLYLNMEGADTLDIRLQFGQRGRAIANTSWALNAADEPLLRVHGTHGQLIGRFVKDETGETVTEELTLTKFRSMGPDEVTTFSWPKESELRRQLVNFGHCIRYKTQPRNGIDHVRAYVNLRERVFGFKTESTLPNGKKDMSELIMSVQ